MANRYFINIGANWGDTANWSDTSGGTGGFSVPTNADDVFFDANSGNCTVNASARTAKTLDFTGYTNTITMTFGITVSGSVTLVAAMTIAGASGLTINATGTFTSNGKTWPNALTFSATNTLTLADDLSVTGLITISGATTVNGSFNINANGGLTVSAGLNKGTGTPKINLTGGTWSGGSVLAMDIDINGNITCSGNFYIGGTNVNVNYISGIVSHTSTSILGFWGNGTVYNTSGMFWNGITSTTGATITLISDFNVNGLFNNGENLSITGNFNINCYGGRSGSNVLRGGGTNPIFNLYGGILSGGGVSVNTNIIGNINITGNVSLNANAQGGGTMTYISGNVSVSRGSVLIISTGTYINFDKINFRTVTINAGATLTMNKFFSGSALIPTRIQSSTTANYTIAFQDTTEKITKFTKISNCTLSRPGQLLCLTDNSNKGGNVGIRYINQMPNGVAKNAPTVTNQMSYGLSQVVDPNCILR